MVVGLERFAAHFAGYRDQYVLIGGAATMLLLEDAGIEPRATKDLDIVLCVEALTPEFGRAFWEFIRQGGYVIQEKSEGSKLFYRFRQPAQPEYPAMLELFSRTPDQMVLGDDSHLTPIPLGADVSSLSAILLDENYYHFLHRYKRELEGVSIVGEECLIPLKARAWLDLTKRKAAGEQVDSRDIKKHRSDVLRLYLLLSPEARIETPEAIRQDLGAFLNAVEPELTPQLLAQVGIKGVDGGGVIKVIGTVYGVVR